MKTADALRKLDADTDAEVFITGGYVRDLLRRKRNHDLDIVIRGVPLRVIKAFLTEYGIVKEVTLSRTNDLFEVNLLLFRTFDDDMTAEISLPRRGKRQIPHYRNTLQQDAQIRDFTLNAMYLPINAASKADVIDIVGGKEAIRHRTIKSNGNPYERITESPIRILRAISLASRINYKIDKPLLKAMADNVALLDKCPADAIRAELDEILLSRKPSVYFRLMLNLGILAKVMPELANCSGVTQHERHHKYDVFEHCIRACDNIDPELTLRLAAILHDVGKPACRAEDEGGIHFHIHEIIGASVAKKLLKRLGYDNRIQQEVCGLVRLHMYHYTREFTDAAVRRLIATIGLTEDYIGKMDQFPLFRLRIADRLGNGFKPIPVTRRQLDFEERVLKILAEDNAFSIKDLEIDGKDLISTLKIRQGPLIGRILRHLLEQVLDDPSLNKNSVLMELAKQFVIDADVN